MGLYVGFRRSKTRGGPYAVAYGPPRHLGRTLQSVLALALQLTGDELLHRLVRLFVAVLNGRRLHEVGARRQDRAADAAVLSDLRGAYGVDDDAGGVRGVPDLELVLQVQW